jgi:two-component system chemotaxis sensor kinase CheA
MSYTSKIPELVEQLALQTVLIEPDDIMALGSILEKLELIEKEEKEGNFPSLRGLGGALKRLVEKIVLQEFPNPQEGCQLLREGIRVLQQRLTPQPSSPVNEEEKNFYKKIESFFDSPQEVRSEKGENSIGHANDMADSGKDLNIYMDFISEGMEHLSAIELHIINLEQEPANQETINAIFRPFHTIKGVAGFLNLHEIQKFSHAMESLLDDARNGRLSINQEIIDFILDAVDVLKGTFLDLKGNLDAGRVGHAPLEMDSYLKRASALRSAAGEDSHSLDRNAQSKKDESIPPPLGEILQAKGVVSKADIQQALKDQAEKTPDMKIGEILVKEKKARPQEVIEALRDQKKVLSQITDSTVKVDTQKLDNLVDMVGELIISQSMIQLNPSISSTQDPQLIRDLSRLKRITADLQRISMSLRMVPIRQTFQKMIRLVRDLTKKSGKQVQLFMAGEETEIDRNLVDTLYDPLVHMIRNSVDHGIEPPEVRKAKGKAETGRIDLRAFQRGGYIVIEIEDDGQGLNREKILQKARERGLIGKEAFLSESQIDNLIFEPGFSTADRVTDISGRGVGMDVVRKAIEQLRGKVDIFSAAGKGCRFVMQIPLTLAIMDGIGVRIGTERYIIPTVFIKETLQPKPKDIQTLQKSKELIKVRESVLPLIRLHEILGIPPERENPWDGLVIIAENAGHRKGLLVDDLLGKQEVVIKSLGEKLKSVKGVAGATIMGDGRVALILDIQGIWELDPSNGLAQAA